MKNEKTMFNMYELSIPLKRKFREYDFTDILKDVENNGEFIQNKKPWLFTNKFTNNDLLFLFFPFLFPHVP